MWKAEPSRCWPMKILKEKRTNKRQQTSIKEKVRYAAVACAFLVRIFGVPPTTVCLRKCSHWSRSAARVFELCLRPEKIPLLENQPFLSQSTSIASAASRPRSLTTSASSRLALSIQGAPSTSENSHPCSMCYMRPSESSY